MLENAWALFLTLLVWLGIVIVGLTIFCLMAVVIGLFLVVVYTNAQEMAKSFREGRVKR